MWKRILRIHTFFSSVYRVNCLLPCSERHLVPLWNSRDTDGYLQQTTPHLTFSTEEEEIGAQLLRDLGIPVGADFVCFNARNSLYLETTLYSSNWNYHSYRNSTIRNYVPAMEEVCRRGYFAIRMGGTVDQPICSSYSNLIDYASRGRTDFLDIYLLAKCRFFVGDTAGLVAVPEAFRRPYLMVNAIPIENICSWWPQILFIPKRLWLQEQERFLSFKEIYATGASRFMHTTDYDRLGIVPMENTPEEILAAVAEIDDRLGGTWQGCPEDDLLQKSFWDLFPGDRASGKSAFRHGTISTRIGSMFLRQNYSLLSD